MSSSWLGLMELFVGAAVVLGWAVIELVILRRDKRQAAERERLERAAAEGASSTQGAEVQDSDQRSGG